MIKKEVSVCFQRKLYVCEERATGLVSYDLQNERFPNQLSRQEAVWTKTGRQAHWVEFSSHKGMEIDAFAIFQNRK